MKPNSERPYIKKNNQIIPGWEYLNKVLNSIKVHADDTIILIIK